MTNKDVKGYFPKEWVDDEIMTFLFSPFRQSRNVNPISWDKKMKFWKEMIYQQCCNDKTAIVYPESVHLNFKRDGKYPVCLSTIIEDLKRSNDLVDAETIQQQNQGWLSWGLGIFVKKPLSWSFSKVTGITAQNNGPLIYQSIIKEKTAELLEFHYSHCDSRQWSENTIEMRELREKSKSIIADDLTFDCVINEMCQTGKAAIVCSEDTKLIRFKTLNTGLKSPVGQTDVDIKLVKIKQTENLLSKEINEITKNIEGCQNEAKLFIKERKKAQARNCLREKHLLTQRRERKEKSLQTLFALRQQILDSESTKQVLDAYTAGTTAFKDMTSLYGLNVDNIDNIMSDIQEVADTTADINNTLSTPIDDQGLDVSSADLEMELENLLADEEKTNDTKDVVDDLAELDDLHLGDLPEVPKFDPSMHKQNVGSYINTKHTTDLKKMKEQLYAT